MCDRLVVVAMLFWVSCSPALGNSVSSYFDDKRFDFEFSCDDLRSGPAWLDENDNPPLAPREALRIARVQLSALMQNSERWRLSKVVLRPACTEHHWFYVVAFSPPPPRPDEGITSAFELVVLMNGQTIEPKVSPWRAP